MKQSNEIYITQLKKLETKLVSKTTEAKIYEDLNKSDDSSRREIIKNQRTMESNIVDLTSKNSVLENKILNKNSEIDLLKEKNNALEKSMS